jgi:hypothetical protein
MSKNSTRRLLEECNGKIKEIKAYSDNQSVLYMSMPYKCETEKNLSIIAFEFPDSLIKRSLSRIQIVVQNEIDIHTIQVEQEYTYNESTQFKESLENEYEKRVQCFDNWCVIHIKDFTNALDKKIAICYFLVKVHTYHHIPKSVLQKFKDALNVFNIDLDNYTIVDLLDEPEKQLVQYGFFRKIEQTLCSNMIIPDSIKQMICQYNT